MVIKTEDTNYQRHYIPMEMFIEYEGHCRVIIQQGVLWSRTELMRVSVLYQRKKEQKGHQIIETTDYFKVQMQRNYHFQIKGSEATL